jgi:hypothetical protein
MTGKLYHRESIVDLLADIAANQPRRSESELVCAWFDDFYLPAFDPQPYAPDVWMQGLRDFESCFTARELEALAGFHDFYDDWDTSGNKDWRPVREQAAKALEVFR